MIAATGFARTTTRPLARLALLLKCYGAWMVRAEQAFAHWQRSGGAGVSHEMYWQDYLAASEKAARMFSRHNRLVTALIAPGCSICDQPLLPHEDADDPTREPYGLLHAGLAHRSCCQEAAWQATAGKMAAESAYHEAIGTGRFGDQP